MGGRRETERWIEILNSAWNEEDTARVLKQRPLSDSSGPKHFAARGGPGRFYFPMLDIYFRPTLRDCNARTVYSAGSEGKAKLRPHACQAVPEAITDADPRIIEDPQLGWLGGTNIDPELELIGDLEWTLTWEREFGRWEEVIVNEGDSEVRLQIKTERVPNFQAVLERPVVCVRA